MTADRQLVTEHDVERNHGWAMGNSRNGDTSGPTVRSGSTPEVLSPDSDVHLPTMEAGPSTVADDNLLARKIDKADGFCDCSKVRAGLQQRLSWTKRWCKTTVSI